MKNSTRSIAALSLPILLLVSGLLGFYELFANFRTYDDEGQMMVSSQLLLDGFVPYKDIRWIYGPVQIAFVQFLHDGLGIPITHSAVRFITLALWLVMSAIAGLLIARLTASIVWGFTLFLLVFSYTGSIVNEPGHPQSLILLLTLLIPLAACTLESIRPRLAWFLVGTLIAAIFHIKFNIGAYLIAGISVVMASQFRPSRFKGLLKPLLIAASAISPFILMLPLLSAPGCAAFALLASLSTVAVAIIAPTSKAKDLSLAVAVWPLLAGLLMLSIAATLYAAVIGFSVPDIVSSMVSYARQQSNFYHFFSEYSQLQLIMAVVSMALAAWVAQNPHGKRKQSVICSAKSYMGLVAIYSLIVDSPANAHFLLGYTWPWCWLILLPPPGRSLSTARLLLAGIAAWSPLIAYPIPGSQLYFGGVPILIIATVCVADVLEDPGTIPVLRAIQRRFQPGLIPATISLAICVVWLCWQLVDARRLYNQHQPLALHGTDFMRIEPNLGRIYRQLVAETATADLTVTTFRLSSLYLWNPGSIPHPSFFSLWSLQHAPPDTLRHVKAGLLQANRPVVVMRKPRPGDPAPSGINAWINQHFRMHRDIGPYRVMYRRD